VPVSGGDIERRAAQLPTGTVTFLFSDIEGSTVRWERAPVAMQEALARHDRLLKAAIVENDGYVFKTIGDAFCAVFSRSESAIAAALAIESSLAHEDFSAVDGIRVRIALHSGTADERDDDYFGPVVNRVARLLSVAHGGQIVVSGVAADLAVGGLPTAASLRDMGEHRLKDLTTPERVYQLLAPGLADDFPPLRSLGTYPNNLPVQLTSFVGRDHEVAEIGALLGKSRLVTLVGAGGVGKTRIALQAAANILESYPDGVWIVELAPLTDPRFIPGAVASALGITLPQEGDPIAVLCAALRPKTAFVILDNCEHVIHEVAQGVATVLRECPNLKLLATSRERLGINGEQAYRMPTLRFPKAHDIETLDAASAMSYGAVALFVDRARSSDHRFSLTDENARFVGEIVQRLDGIALAIELAAPRVKMLSLAQLRQKLDERFRLLTGGNREALPRQKTLRALIDWSYDLLDGRERALFRRTGMFVNGFSLEAAGTVASDEDLDEFEALDALSSLVDKSLVTAEIEADATRYTLLESTRAYALEKLSEAKEQEELAKRHALYFAQLARDADREREGSGNENALMALLPDLENLRAAAQWSIAENPIAGATIASVANGALWERIGVRAEWVRRLRDLLEVLPEDATDSRAAAFGTLTYLYAAGSNFVRGAECGEAAVANARAANDSHLLARSLALFAQDATMLRRFDDARDALDEAETLGIREPRARLRVVAARALLASMRGDRDAAAAAAEDQLAIARAMGNLPAEAIATLNWADIEHSRDATGRAIALIRELVESDSWEALGRDTRAFAYGNLAAYLASVDDVAGSLAAAGEALRLTNPSDLENATVACTLEHTALALALDGRIETAAAIGGYCVAAFASHGFERDVTEQRTFERLDAILAERLTPFERVALTDRGEAMTAAAAFAEARGAVAGVSLP
jgi:predicted ATPase/class 3 adenylate cyclase